MLTKYYFFLTLLNIRDSKTRFSQVQIDLTQYFY